MKHTLEFILKKIFGEDVAFSINEREEEATGHIILEITIDDELKGKLIGKNGVTIKSINTLLNIQAKKEDSRVHIKVLD